MWKSISLCIYFSFVPRELVQLISLLTSSRYWIVLVSLGQSSQWCWDVCAAGSCAYNYWKHLHLKCKKYLNRKNFDVTTIGKDQATRELTVTTNRFCRHIAWAKSVLSDKEKFCIFSIASFVLKRHLYNIYVFNPVVHNSNNNRRYSIGQTF